MPFRSGQALSTGYATLVLVTSIAKQSRANGNVSFGHSPTTNVDNPNALYVRQKLNLNLSKIMTKKEQVQYQAIQILSNSPNGIKYSELVSKLRDYFKEFPEGTITGSVWNLDSIKPDLVYKAARGLFKHKVFQENDFSSLRENNIEEKTISGKKIKEDDFYESFANWLEKDMEECSKAISLGKNIFKDKWGTPDVIGILKSKESDIIKFPTEITSVEIKLDNIQVITAFGQACAYKLFSHKVYLEPVPKLS